MRHMRSNASLSSRPLRAMVSSACRANPLDPLISPVSEHSYSTLFGLIPVTLAVLRSAVEVEPSPMAVMQWYRSTPIMELGGLCAEELVAMGRAEVVIGFLHSLRDGERD